MKLNFFAKALTLSLLAGGLASLASADWPQFYDGPAHHDDAVTHAATDASGNLYICGYSDDVTTGRDYLTTKYDRLGHQKWIARFDGGSNQSDYPVGMAVDGSGNVFVTGFSEGLNTGNDYVTVKYDTNGNQQWWSRLDGGRRGLDSPRAIGVDSKGNAFVTGTTAEQAGGSLLTVKYAPDGTVEWMKKYAASSESANDSRDLVVDGDDNVIVTASSYLNDLRGFDYVTVKYDNAGNQQWAKKLDGTLGDDEVSAMTADPKGNVLVTGYSQVANGTYDILTVKYDSVGNKLWERRFGLANVNEFAQDLVVSPDSSICVTGLQGTIGGLSNIVTISYDDAGTKNWSRSFSSSPATTSGDAASAIGVDNAGNVYVCGTAQVWFPGAIPTFVTIKYAADGTHVWTKPYGVDATSPAGAAALAVDMARGKVYVAGSAFNPLSGSSDYAVVKY